MSDCDRTARSMRALPTADRNRVERVTLEIEVARPSETLRQFNVRTGNHWTVSQTAAANGIKLPYKLATGQRIKFDRTSPYVAQPQAPASEPSEPAEQPVDPRELEIEVEEGAKRPGANESPH